MGILGVLAAVTTIILNPVELIAQSRDSNRFSGLDAINRAIALSQAESPGYSVPLGNANTLYVSLPDSSPTCANLGLPILSSGWAYSCVTSSNLKLTNGNGWVPINFAVASTGSQLSGLPIDPINSTSTSLYYTYATNGKNYELTAYLE